MKKLSIIIFILLSIQISKIRSQNGIAPKIGIDTTVHDFGKVKEENGIITHRFNFINNGKSPLIIKNVEVTCGCSSSGWSKEPIAPGGKGFVDASFNPKNRPGMFTRIYTVVSNADNNELPLKLVGEVIPASTVKKKQPEIVFQSNSYTFEEKEGKVVKYLYQFENTGSEALQISEVKTSCDCVKAIAKAKTIQPGSKSGIEVTFNTINEVGIHQVSITVLSNAKNQEKSVLTFNGKVIK